MKELFVLCFHKNSEDSKFIYLVIVKINALKRPIVHKMKALSTNVHFNLVFYRKKDKYRYTIYELQLRLSQPYYCYHNEVQ